MKSKRIKNPHYVKFLEEGVIDFIKPEHLNLALANVKGQYTKQARALLICLYYTGARPSEVLKLKGKDISRERGYLRINITPSKNSLPRPIMPLRKLSHIHELENYAFSIFPEMLLFPNFISTYEREYKKKNGEIVIYKETSRKVRYLVYNAFEGVFAESLTPYVFRHNRFSKLADIGATLEDIRHLKGAKSMDSVTPYLHMSTAKAKKLGGKIR